MGAGLLWGVGDNGRWLPIHLECAWVLLKHKLQIPDRLKNLGMAVENGRLSQQIQSSLQSLADSGQTLHEIRQLLDVE